MSQPGCFQFRKPIILYLSCRNYHDAPSLHVPNSTHPLYVRLEVSKAEDGEHPLDVAEPRPGELVLNVIWPDDVCQRPGEPAHDTLDTLINEVAEAGKRLGHACGGSDSIRLQEKLDCAIVRLESFCDQHLVKS